MQKLPECMREFLTNSTNKHHFIKYLFLKWCYNFDKKLSDNQVIYFADIDGSAIKITQQGSAVLEFNSDYKEANIKSLHMGSLLPQNIRLKG